MMPPTEPLGPAVLPVRWGDKLGRLGRLVRKELFEILRDRRTIITLVLMPLLLYPLLCLAFQQFFLAQQVGSTTKYRLGFISQDEGMLVLRYLGIHWDKDKQEYRPTRKDPTRQETGPQPFLDIPAPELVRGFEKQIWKFPIDVGIRVRNLNQVRRNANRPPLDLELIYLEGSPESQAALKWVEYQCSLANIHYLRRRLTNPGQPERPVPVHTARVAHQDPEKKDGNFLAVLVPLILILMTVTGAVYPAIDLTAGERERGTLEILVAAPVPRLGLLFAKYVTVLVVAMLTALANVVMMTLTLLVMDLGPKLFGDSGLTVAVVLQVFGLMLLFAAFFSAVLLTLTSFARSFKEAQAYLIPVMLVSLTPGMLVAVKSDLPLTTQLAVAPLINIVLLARDLLQQHADPLMAVVVVLSTMLYALAALALAARIFGAEGVLYSEQGSWADLFRRPAQARPTATVSGALFCLALLFTTYFLVNGLIGTWRSADPGLRIGLVGLATVALFAGFPLAAVFLGRVRPVTGFQLAPGRWLAYPAAVLLGLSLWAFVLEIQLGLRWLGLTVLGSEQEKQFAEVLASWRQLSPFLVVLVLGGITPVCEELFFRGYLFSALRAQVGPKAAILGSALLFGLFHVVFAFDRLVPSTLLGLVLGWVCWRTGSVFPGMVLHACHNSFLVMVSYYEAEIVGQGWFEPGKSHLPVTWLAGAAVAAILGAFLIRLASRPSAAAKELVANPVEGIP
jgi:ABC-2 type transport system permease protein/sodium transport system permease protein